MTVLNQNRCKIATLRLYITGDVESCTLFQCYVESRNLYEKFQPNCQRYVVPYLVYTSLCYISTYTPLLVLHTGKNQYSIADCFFSDSPSPVFTNIAYILIEELLLLVVTYFLVLKYL